MRPRRCNREFQLNGLKKYLVALAISLTTALVCQSTALVWWAGALTARVEIMEKSLNGLTDRVHTIEISRPFRP